MPVILKSCRSCRARITWLTTSHGKRVPVDVPDVRKAPDSAQVYDPRRHASHFSSCLARKAEQQAGAR